MASFFACSDSESTVFEDPIFTARIDFDGDGRIAYTKTGPDWGTPNEEIDTTLLELGEGQLDPDGLLLPDRAEMAAYVSGSVAKLTFYPQWKDNDDPPAGKVCLEATLVPRDGAPEPEGELFNACSDLEVKSGKYSPVEISTTKLPANTAALYDLQIKHTYEVGKATYAQKTSQELALLWQAPIPAAPLYKRIIRYGSLWLAGRYDELDEKAENELADLLLEKMKILEQDGHSYGAFPRPSSEDYTNTAEVFLDFKRSACGEFRGFFLALLESQGIDGNWLLFWFNEPSAEKPSMYQTIEIAALGREKKVWRYSNHIVVEVNGIVYDPTYLVREESMETFEDYLFDSFCLGKEDPCGSADDWCSQPGGPQNECVDNKPGYNEGNSPPIFRGEDYG